MRLSDYFKKMSINKTAFADKLDISRATLHNAELGKSITLETAVKIQIATEGKVTCQDLVSPEMLNKIQKELKNKDLL